MSLEQIANLGGVNVMQTYLNLGMQAPGARELREAGVTACIGETELAICNFAIGINCTNPDHTIEKLRQWSVDVPAFRVFTLPGDKPLDFKERLSRGGFFRAHRLTQMCCTPGDVRPQLPIAEALIPEERLIVARFMIDQFFWRWSVEIREIVALATASTDHSLFFSGDLNCPVAGVMVVRTEGILGLYNLCVAQVQRNLGIGGSVVGAIQNLANTLNLPVTLQCDNSLVGWYSNLGFEISGFLDTFLLEDG